MVRRRRRSGVPSPRRHPISGASSLVSCTTGRPEPMRGGFFVRQERLHDLPAEPPSRDDPIQASADSMPLAPSSNVMPGEKGILPFRIQRDGTWLYRGSPIRRKPMVCLFSSVLRRDGDGRYRLETPTERGLIEVEDAPFVAVELHWSGNGRGQSLSFRLNTDEMVCAGPEHPLQVDGQETCSAAFSRGAAGAVPYLTVRRGDGTHPIQARILRPVYYELVALAVEGSCAGRPCQGVWSRYSFFPIGPAAETRAVRLSGAASGCR